MKAIAGTRVSQILTSEEEMDLFCRYKSGDDGARDAIITANLPLVKSIARKRQYALCGIETDDLVQEGVIGLCKALEKYDPTQGRKFSSYAYFWIRAALTRAIELRSRTIRLPADVIWEASRVAKARRSYEQKTGRSPILDDLVEMTGIQKDRVLQVMDAERRPVSLDAPVDEDRSMISTLADPSAVDPCDYVLMTDALKTVRMMMDYLPRHERTILSLRYGLDGPAQSQREIGERLGMSRTTVGTHERRALQRLQEAVGDEAR